MAFGREAQNDREGVSLLLHSFFFACDHLDSVYAIPFAPDQHQPLASWRSRVGGWSVDDWAVTVSTLPFVFARVLIASGVGLRAKVE